MAKNPPPINDDDDDVPAWLKNAGFGSEKPGGAQGTTPSPPSSTPPAKSGPASPQGTPRPPQSSGSDDAMPWMKEVPTNQPDAPKQGGLTGALPWRQGVSNPADKPGGQSSSPDINWSALDNA